MTNPIPEGHEGIIAHLVVGNAREAIAFYEKAFDAKEVWMSPSPDGKIMHAEILIDGRPVYLCDDFPEFCGGQTRDPKKLGSSSVTIHRYVEDCDAAIERAASAGATVAMPPTDMFWGDRYGSVTDPYGHQWSFATHQKDLSPEEVAAAAEAAFSGPPPS